ncbi:MAG: hypothetical protein HS111_12905 [Kofleriaceae bacterium]|nr:hypothetical protein [Kofleriaceae bacterium]
MRFRRRRARRTPTRDETDADAQHTFVTQTSPGRRPLLVVSLAATRRRRQRRHAPAVATVDNTPPVIEIAGVGGRGGYASARTVTFTHSDAHLGTATATLDGSPFTTGTTVSREGRRCWW